jgi:hypothetical protein
MTEFTIKNILTEELFGNRICESLEDKLIVDYLYEELMLEKLLYGEPVTVPELRALLRQKILNFEFIKLNGEVRPAKGTTMMKYIPRKQHPKGIRPSSLKVATFYDLEKMDWRSVSQRSKEIVLKKDEDTGKPVVMVKDKPEGGDIAIRDKQPEKTPKVIKEPEVTLDDIPIDTDIEKPTAQVKSVKPIKSTEGSQMFYFVNPKTGASRAVETTPQDAVKQLSKMGKDWELTDEKDYKDSEEAITSATEKEPDYIKIGDKRNYLNRKGENVEIEVVGEDPYGGFYAKTPSGAMFKIPGNKMQNIGTKIKTKETEEAKTKEDTESIINKLSKDIDLDNIEAEEF